MTSDPSIRVDSPFGHWHVSAVIPDDERKILHVDKFAMEHRGKPFLTVGATLWAAYGDHGINAAVNGPNLKNDGTPGAYTLGGRLTPAELAEGYPQTWAMIVLACGDLITRIGEDAALGVRQVEQAIAIEVDA